MVPIMSHKAAAGPAPEGKTTVELNRGDGLVGTGPYKFVSWKRGAEIVFERNDHYWGEKPTWDKVIYRRSEEHTSELQSLMRISYAVFCLKKKIRNTEIHND